MVCIVRNPIDVIPSYAYLSSFVSHSLVPNEKLHVDFPEWWNEWVVAMSRCIQFNHTFVVDNLAKEIPTYILRYEDLLINPEPVLIECFQFLLDVPTIEGTVVEKRIKDISSSGFASKSVYKLKTSTKDLMKNSHMYTEA